MGSWTNVAALLRAKTNEGGLSVKPTEGLPFLLEKGMEVTFVPPVLRIPRSGKVLDVEEIAQGRYMVWFDCIDNRTDAEKLEGHFCLVRTSCLPENYMGRRITPKPKGETFMSVLPKARNSMTPLLSSLTAALCPLCRIEPTYFNSAEFRVSQNNAHVKMAS